MPCTKAPNRWWVKESREPPAPVGIIPPNNEKTDVLVFPKTPVATITLLMGEDMSNVLGVVRNDSARERKHFFQKKMGGITPGAIFQ